MARLGNDETSEAEWIVSNADRRRRTRGAMFDDMTAMTDEFEDEGWETVRILVGDNNPFGPSSGKGGEGVFDFAYVIPGDKAETVANLFEAILFLEYEMYRVENDSRVCIVTALFSPETEIAVFIAGAWDLRGVPGCAIAVAEEGRMHSYLQKLDDTVVSVVEHDDPERSFPNFDATRRYAPNSDGGGKDDEN